MKHNTHNADHNTHPFSVSFATTPHSTQSVRRSSSPCTSSISTFARSISALQVQESGQMLRPCRTNVTAAEAKRRPSNRKQSSTANKKYRELVTISSAICGAIFSVISSSVRGGSDNASGCASLLRNDGKKLRR